MRGGWTGLAASTAFLVAASLLQSQTPPPIDPKLAQEFDETTLVLLEDNCNACHSGPRAQGKFNLMDIGGAADLAAQPELLERMIGYIKTRSMPPAGAPQPSAADRQKMVEGLERLFSATCNLADAGRVTIRRLNQFEYENSVRDLLGLDDMPDVEFPRDNEGYGFDNNGDVLTLSPLQMEKYLASAEQIAQLVIPATAPKTITFDLSKYGTDQARVFENGLYMTTNATVSLRAQTVPGDYELKLVLGGQQAGPEVVKAGLRLNGAAQPNFEVKGGPANPSEFLLPIPVTGNELRIDVSFLNDYYNPEHPDPAQRDRNMIIQEVTLTGPMNARAEMTAARRRFFAGTTGDDKAKAHAALTRFAQRAYRRPLKPGEADRIMSLYDMATEANLSYEERVQVGLTGILVSPHFLFRVELDERSPDGSSVAVGSYELASRLSYFLWGSAPDDALLEAAKIGELETEKGLEKAVDRMLKDARAERLADGFAMQWLQLRRLEEHQVAPKVFPDFTPSLRAAMLEETRRFFTAIVQEDLPLNTFLDADFTFVNGELARHYGISVSNNGWQRVKVGEGRRGLLGQAAFLTSTSNPNRTSPVKRGRFILDNILGTPLPPPPPDVGALAEDAKAMEAASLRERMEEHRKNPACISCHSVMDPIGFALENYDAVGKWREMDGPHEIDPSGVLPDGTKFAGASGLTDILVSREDEFVTYLGERLLTYAIGRGMRAEDQCHVDEIRVQTRERGDTFAALVKAIVLSEPFRMRGPSTQ